MTVRDRAPLKIRGRISVGDEGREGRSSCVFYVLGLFFFNVVIMPKICILLIRALTDTQQSGYQQKALNKSNKPEGVYEHPRVGIKEIKQKERNLVPRTANYSRFSIYFSE